jgi:hypothetical protein
MITLTKKFLKAIGAFLKSIFKFDEAPDRQSKYQTPYIDNDYWNHNSFWRRYL